MYHGTVYTNKQIRKLLKKAGIPADKFCLQIIKGKPAKMKNKIDVQGNKITIFGNDFIAKGFIYV